MPCSRRIGHFFILAYFWRGFGGLGRKKRSTFAAKFESMNFISAILTAIAYKNLSDAKKKYESEKENYDLVDAAIRTYNDSQEHEKENLEKYNSLPGDGNSSLSAVKVSFVLRVGNLVGKKMTSRLTLVLSNTSSDLSYALSKFKANVYVDGVLLNTTFEHDGAINLYPGKTIELTCSIPGSKILLVDSSNRDNLRSIVCKAAGKKVITSCPNTTVENVANADIEFQYRGVLYNGKATRAIYNGVSGVLRYCGEAYYPKN